MTVTIKLRIVTGAYFERFGPFDLGGKRPEQDGSKRRVLEPPTGNATDPNGRCSSINRLISQMSCLSRVTAEPCRIPPATPAEWLCQLASTTKGRVISCCTCASAHSGRRAAACEIRRPLWTPPAR